MNNSGAADAIVIVATLFVVFALPMILIAWVVVSVLSAPLGWLLACIGSCLFGIVIGYAAGKGRRQ